MTGCRSNNHLFSYPLTTNPFSKAQVPQMRYSISQGSRQPSEPRNPTQAKGAGVRIPERESPGPTEAPPPPRGHMTSPTEGSLRTPPRSRARQKGRGTHFRRPEERARGRHEPHSRAFPAPSRPSSSGAFPPLALVPLFPTVSSPPAPLLSLALPGCSSRTWLEGREGPPASPAWLC